MNTAVQRQRTTAAMRRSSTRAFYDVNCAAYSDATMSLDTSGAIARFAALVTPGGRVLDAGCGSGRDLLRLQSAGLDPIGLDISAKLAEIARSNSSLPVVEGDLRHPPFPAASFDGIWAMASLLHLERDETGPALSGLAALLRPRGVLFSSVKRGNGRARDADGRWFTFHDEASLTTHLRDAGFEIVEMRCEQGGGGGTGSVTPGWISSLARKL